MTARRLETFLPYRKEWRKHRHWRGRCRALFRSLRNSGNPRAHTEAEIRTGEEYVMWLEART